MSIRSRRSCCSRRSFGARGALGACGAHGDLGARGARGARGALGACGAHGALGTGRRHARGLALAWLVLGLVASSSAVRAEPLARDHVWPSTGAARAEPTRADAPEFCTFATCAPRPPDPFGGALAFGGAVLLAGVAARRANARRR